MKKKYADVFEDENGNHVYVQRDKINGKLFIVMGYGATAYDVELTKTQAITFARNILNVALEVVE